MTAGRCARASVVLSMCGVVVTIIVVVTVGVLFANGSPSSHSLSHTTSASSTPDGMHCNGFKVRGICFDNRRYRGWCYDHDCCGPDEMYYEDYCYFIILHSRSVSTTTTSTTTATSRVLQCVFILDDQCYAYRIYVGSCWICCDNLHGVVDSNYCYYGIVADDIY